MAEPERPPRHRAASTDRKILRSIVYGLLALLFAFAILVAYQSGVSMENPWPFIVFGLPALLLARRSYRHGKRRYADHLSDEDLDDEAPVLFLRPFQQDAGWDGAVAFSLFRPATWRKLLYLPTNFRALYLEMTGRLSFEQVLAHVVRKIGPLVAIGEPDQAPILGARNLYVGDDGWQQQVRDLAARSKLVVLTAGTSEGVLWEVRTMVEQVPPERFLLNVPGVSRGERRDTYESFQQVAAELFPSGLPETLNGARFLSFDEGWEPQTAKVKRPAESTPPWVARRLSRLLL